MSRKKAIPQLIALAVSLICLLVCVLLSASLRGKLTSQQAKERWQSDSELRFAQVSCFLPVSSTVGEDSVYSFRTTLDSKLLDASLEAEEGQSLYLDAWSASGSLTIVSDRGSATASALGVGGDWFFFHPLQLRSGGYLSYDDLMHDRLVLDEDMAWRLFGSVDVAGMEVTINGVPYQVAGVVARESDFASQKSYTGGAGVFIAYDTLAALGSVSGISCYEIVLPDPISGFATGVVKDSFPVGEGDVVENSGRYSLSARFKLLGSFGKRSMKTTPVTYPYWENAARLIEDYLAVLLILTLLFAIVPLVWLIWLAVRAIRWLGSKKGRLRAAVSRRVERRREQEYETEAQRRQAERSRKRQNMRRVQQQREAQTEQEHEQLREEGVLREDGAEATAEDAALLSQIGAVVGEVQNEQSTQK